MSHRNKLRKFKPVFKPVFKRNNNLLYNFDVTEYKKINIDLQHMTDEEAMEHYNNHGIYENRKYKNTIPDDFHVTAYKKLNIDLQDMTDEEAMNHYKTHGIYENRKCKITIPTEFNVNIYKQINRDLQYMTDEEAYNHYINLGFYENRVYELPIPCDFNALDYKKMNTELNYMTDIEAYDHFINYGFIEGRKYKSEPIPKIQNNIFDYVINEKLSDFLQIHNVSEEEMKSNPKVEFRYECFKNIPYMRHIILPEIQQNSYYEAVLIEYRCFPHLEFLIRNTINKLGDKWSHTIVCGILNYDYMIDMCKNISSEIKVIKTDFENLNQNTYSEMLSSNYFWNYFVGEKILIYQEDSIIFKNNINDFLHWDYVGAPWPEHQNDNKSGVGNGGISLRSKSTMKQIIETVNIKDTLYNSTTINYATNNNLEFFPEDVYFTKNMEDFNIGVIADRNSAPMFSTESILNNNSFAGHNFWISDSNWKQRIYDNVVIQFNPTYNIYIDSIQHRGGWKNVIYNLNKINLFSTSSNFYFFDTIEIYFLVNKYYYIDSDWAGIIHWTPNVPGYLNNIYDINNMFNSENFIKSLKNCKFLITLSVYISNYVKNKINELNLNIDVITLKHPISDENIMYFDINNYINNENKLLMQIGQQLRNIRSIYMIEDTNNHAKLWLTGNHNMNICDSILNNELNFHNITDISLQDTQKYYTKSFEEYDSLLSQNIVFIDLIDAGANNAILECILRNTPIIVNKIPPVVEYLGEDYPLYFSSLKDVTNLLHIDKIIEAHNYLKNMNKTDIMIDTFNKSIVNITNKYYK